VGSFAPFANFSPIFSISQKSLKFCHFRHILPRKPFLPKRQKTPQNRKTHQTQNLTETIRKFPQVPLRTRPAGTPDHPKVHFALPSFQAQTPSKLCSAETHQARNLTETIPKFPQVPLRTRPPGTHDHIDMKYIAFEKYSRCPFSGLVEDTQGGKKYHLRSPESALCRGRLRRQHGLFCFLHTSSFKEKNSKP